MSEKEFEKKEKETQVTKTPSENDNNDDDDNANDNLDEAGVPKMTPLQKRLFELRRKGVTNHNIHTQFILYSIHIFHFIFIFYRTKPRNAPETNSSKKRAKSTGRVSTG